MTSIAAIHCWCFFYSFATWIKSRWLYASARMLNDNTPNNVCIRIDKKTDLPTLSFRAYYIFFLYFSFFPVLLFFSCCHGFFPLFYFLSFVYCIFTCWPQLKWTQAPTKKNNHRSNNLMKSKNKTISHISWTYGHTHTLTEWLTHGIHSPSFNRHRSIIVTQSMRDRDRQGKEMQSF